MASFIFLSGILCSLIFSAQGAMLVLNACKAHWMNITCEKDDLLTAVEISLQVGQSKAGPCYGYVHDPTSEYVPNHLKEHCSSAGACMWVPNGCEGKETGCVFYIRPDRLGDVITNSEILIAYNCKMGNQRVMWIVIVCIVGGAFFLLSIVIALIVWHRGKGSESYEQFSDDAPSRTGSMRGATSPVHFSAGDEKVVLEAPKS